MGYSQRSRFLWAILFSLIGCLFVLSSDTLAQDGPGDRYFDEMGHSVAEEIWPFFKANGGLRVFGFPITEFITSDKDGMQVQYFQNGRVEIDPDSGEIRPSPLPVDLYLEKSQPPIPADQVATGAGVQYFEATGHSVRLAFLDFYNRYGGPGLFGYPVTELLDEGDQLKQYFERAIFHWRPDMPDGHRVQLEQLGYLQFEGNDEDLFYLRPVLPESDKPGEIPTVRVLDIRVSATVQTPVMERAGGVQKVYIFVHDQLDRPVMGVQVDVSIVLPEGYKDRSLASTDENGLVVFTIDIPELDPGETVPIKVSATFKELWRGTACSFRVWW